LLSAAHFVSRLELGLRKKTGGGIPF